MSKKKLQSHGIPEGFIIRLADIFGQSLFSQVEKTFIERLTSFRVNTIKATREEVMQTLRDANVSTQQIPWYKDAFILKNKSKRELMELPIYTDGKIYIQSLASMVPPLVLDPKPGETVLDLTAAPGSKTSEMAAFMGKEGRLIANDNNKVRFFKLKHNLELLGVLDESGFLKLRLEDGSRLCGEYGEYFDKILVDAPCSAEARFIAGDPKTYGYWSERKIKEMAYKQRKLLFSAWYALKSGGTLVYSTCTFAPEENEKQVERFLSRFPNAETLPVELSGLKMLSTSVPYAMRLLPTSDVEGFFIAKIRKHA